MAPLRSMLETVKRADSDVETVRKAQYVMDAQSGHIIRLIDDLLDVTLISQGKIELRLEQLELGSLVRHAAEAARPLCENSGRELIMIEALEPIYLRADPTRP